MGSENLGQLYVDLVVRRQQADAQLRVFKQEFERTAQAVESRAGRMGGVLDAATARILARPRDPRTGRFTSERRADPFELVNRGVMSDILDSQKQVSREMQSVGREAKQASQGFLANVKSATKTFKSAFKLLGVGFVATTAIGAARGFVEGFPAAMRGDYRGTLEAVGSTPIIGHIVREFYGLVDALTGAKEAALEHERALKVTAAKIEQERFTGRAIQTIGDMRTAAAQAAALAGAGSPEARAALQAQFGSANQIESARRELGRLTTEAQAARNKRISEAGFTAAPDLESKLSEALLRLRELEAAASTFRGIARGNLPESSAFANAAQNANLADTARANLEKLSPELDAARKEFERLNRILMEANAARDAIVGEAPEAFEEIKQNLEKAFGIDAPEAQKPKGIIDSIATAIGAFRVGQAGAKPANEMKQDKTNTLLAAIHNTLKDGFSSQGLAA